MFESLAEQGIDAASTGNTAAVLAVVSTALFSACVWLVRALQNVNKERAETDREVALALNALSVELREMRLSSR